MSRTVPKGQKCKVCHAKEGKDHKMDCHPPFEYVQAQKSEGKR